MDARKSYIEINYSGIDISKEVSSDLISFSYTDNASGEADNISISLKDEKKNGVDPGFLLKGMLSTLLFTQLTGEKTATSSIYLVVVFCR